MWRRRARGGGECVRGRAEGGGAVGEGRGAREDGGLHERLHEAAQLARSEHVAVESVPVDVRRSLRGGLGWRREGGEDAV